MVKLKVSAGCGHGTGKTQGFGHLQDEDLAIEERWLARIAKDTARTAMLWKC
ncbi:hypothetical protein VIBRN418_08812 [Vibrio sp. N418]|uniref:Uncharacterized protein n=1 Tax=Vibrio scophthalmi LMG 19158 TaxID=870967 RepID=F9RNL6_9VIBR|nr:hypothetical protein VIBRN418_08812 [Vibrio sp. N418]EGU37041.1 hypothetical protein VIS19158_18011 [Vibrio scophthalmi LMG 19158]